MVIMRFTMPSYKNKHERTHLGDRPYFIVVSAPAKLRLVTRRNMNGYVQVINLINVEIMIKA